MMISPLNRGHSNRFLAADFPHGTSLILLKVRIDSPRFSIYHVFGNALLVFSLFVRFILLNIEKVLLQPNNSAAALFHRNFQRILPGLAY